MSSANGLVTLVVDDHPFQRSILKRLLKKLSAHEVLEAENGLEALSILNIAHRVDIIICDLDMPKMDGIEFMRHLASGYQSPSVIISSAEESSLIQSVEKMALDYGVKLLGIIDKPVSIDKLSLLFEKHHAKKAPRISNANRVFDLESILEAVTKDQFEPYFQPKVNLASGRIVGAEALARWMHPEHGVIAPYAFIPLLESSRQIDELTMKIIKKSAEACKRWHEDGLEISISVNLSLASLTNTSLVDKITNIVTGAGLEPRFMTLEITETAAMTEVASSIEILTRLRMRGFGLSVDDYGTGYSSLKQLTRVPFNELKIDQSFVTGCCHNSTSSAIVESSVHMANKLNLVSVAEGVEVKEEWDFLKEKKCDVAQGYFIAKPMSFAHFTQFCSSN